MNNPGITLLGLGPGDPALLTRQAWELIETLSEIYVRTRHHPTVTGLPATLQVQSFDHFYQGAGSFEQVYAQIVEQVLELGRRPQGVVYAVPGHPYIAEATSPEITRRARQIGIPVRIIAGLSFLEPVFTALDCDPLPHTALVDALEFTSAHVPPFPPDAPALIVQIHSRQVASDIKLTLMETYPDEHPVRLVHAAGTPQELVEDLPLYEIDRSRHIDLLTALYVPALPHGASFEAFQEIIAHLRAPDGCPWDREQTHQTLRTHLLEETYEALSALDADNPDKMREEFGDLLLQVVLHAQIANEYGEFNIAQVLKGIYDKIIRRHPHVFGDLQVDGVGHVLQNWEKLKAAERLENGDTEKGLLDGVALALPALSQAEEYQRRAARIGFDWPDLQGVVDKINEECGELLAATSSPAQADEVGDLLFTMVNLARRLEIDAESALRQTNTRFRQRFAFMENAARQQGKILSDLTLSEMDALWEQAKEAEG